MIYGSQVINVLQMLYNSNFLGYRFEIFMTGNGGAHTALVDRDHQLAFLFMCYPVLGVRQNYIVLANFIGHPCKQYGSHFIVIR